MSKFIFSIQRLTGWRAWLLLFIAGLVGALAMPPVGLWPVFMLVFPIAVIRFGTVTTLRIAFANGWLFGFGYFCGVLHWIGFAFLIEADTYFWMMPFAVGGLAAVMAVYWALAACASHLLARWRFPLWLSAPPVFAIAEWLRGHLLTGFPWATPGLAADGMGPILQLAALIGMPGLTLLVVAWSTAPLAVLQRRGGWQRVIAFLLLALLPLGALYGWQRQQVTLAPVEGVGLRVVQPNVSQEDKWRRDNAAQIFENLVAASEAPGAGQLNITHVIWPESAVPFFIDESDGAKNMLRGALSGTKVLVTGAIRRASRDSSADHFTSVLVFDPFADVVGTYDKWRLVPGGEFLPFGWLLEPLGFQRLVSLPGSFSAGPGPQSIAIPGAGFAGVIICYEVIFPDRLVDPHLRPSWIINVTNDGWFGNSVGPYQHLAQARLRAVEQGLPIVRSANTGISAVIDPFGTITTSLAIGHTGFFDAALPQALTTTLYVKWGDQIFVLMLCLSGVLLLISRKD